ncbi:MAG: DUF5683 domain-containing protein, partial [Bacteroidota bacterium]
IDIPDAVPKTVFVFEVQKGILIEIPGTLVIETDPPGASVKVLGEVQQVLTPLELSHKLPGPYEVVLSLADYRDTTVYLEVPNGGKNANPPIKLIPTFGFLRFDFRRIRSENINVKINNLSVATLESVRRFPIRPYTFQFSKDYADTLAETVTPKPGDTVDVPIGRFRRSYGILRLRVQEPDPLKTKIFVNIENDGNVPPSPGGYELHNLTPGNHRITLSAERFEDTTFIVRVLQDDTIRVPSISMLSKERPGRLQVYTDVDASFFLDGVSEGVRKLDVKINPHVEKNVVIRHPVLGEKEITYELEPGENRIEFVSMLPSRDVSHWMSALIPGSSQMYKGETLKGWGYLVATLGGAAGALYYSGLYSNDNTKYQDNVAAYQSASDPATASTRRIVVQNSFNKANADANYRNAFLIGTGALYVWDIADAFLFRPSYGYREEAPNPLGANLDALPSHSTAIALCAFPGISQMYKGETVKGLAFLGVFAAGAAVTITYQNDYTSNETAWHETLDAYHSAPAASNFLALRTAVSNKFDAMNNSENVRNVAFAATAGVYVFDILDAIFSVPKDGYSEYFSMKTGLSPVVAENFVGLNLIVTF